MVKRKRRDLSDPTIKRIVKAQTSSKRSAGNSSQHSAGNRSFFKSAALFILFVMIGGGFAYAIINWEQLPNLLPEDDPSGQQTTIGQPQQTIQAPVQNTTRPAANSGTNTLPQETPPPVQKKIQVEILNGCGVNGLAEKLTDYLRKRNIDVVSRGNYANFRVKATRIVDRKGNSERATTLAEVLGIADNRIQTKKDRSLQLDATIILGADYKRLKPFKN